MLILLPPSETKRPGGVGISIDKAAIIWAALDPARDLLIKKLQEVSRDSDKAISSLKIGKTGLGQLSKNLELYSSPTMPALQRYSGVLYEAIDFQSLGKQAIERAGQMLFIQSALFGLVPAMEQIPDYKFSADSRLEGINLKQTWIQAHSAVWPRMIGPILDMRSSEYRELNPVPEDRDSYLLEVLSSEGKALNHFNKKAKGLFVRSALQHGLERIQEVPTVAKQAGMRAEVDGDRVRLYTLDS